MKTCLDQSFLFIFYGQLVFCGDILVVLPTGLSSCTVSLVAQFALPRRIETDRGLSMLWKRIKLQQMQYQPLSQLDGQFAHLLVAFLLDLQLSLGLLVFSLFVGFV